MHCVNTFCIQTVLHGSVCFARDVQKKYYFCWLYFSVLKKVSVMFEMLHCTERRNFMEIKFIYRLSS